jgi:glutathione S-transferase
VIIPPDKVTTDEVQAWKGLHLLHFAGSTCSQKVRLLLGEFDLSWTSHPIALPKHENATSWFLGVNPRGLVPVLIHDGVVHVESNDILAYLDTLRPRGVGSFYFADDRAVASEARRLMEKEDTLHMDLRLLTIVFGPLSLKNEKQISEQETNGAPDAARAREVAWWRERARNGISEQDIKTACARFRNAFGALEERLKGQAWLMGEHISIVDIAWFTDIFRLLKLGYPLDRHSRLSDYFVRMIERPAFKRELDSTGNRITGLVLSGTRTAKGLGGLWLADYL